MIRFRFMQMGKKNTSIFDLHINPFGSAMLSNVEDEMWLENVEYLAKVYVEYNTVTGLGGHYLNYLLHFPTS